MENRISLELNIFNSITSSNFGDNFSTKSFLIKSGDLIRRLPFNTGKFLSFLFLLYVLSTMIAESQTILCIKQCNGLNSYDSISSIRKITFPQNDSILFTQKNGSSIEFGFGDIMYIAFDNTQTLISEVSYKQELFSLYPNPVANTFTVTYDAAKSGTIILSIVSIQGKVIFQKSFAVESGQNLFTQDVSGIPKGIYICHIQGNENAIDKKFIKN